MVHSTVHTLQLQNNNNKNETKKKWNLLQPNSLYSAAPTILLYSCTTSLSNFYRHCCFWPRTLNSTQSSVSKITAINIRGSTFYWDICWGRIVLGTRTRKETWIIEENNSIKLCSRNCTALHSLWIGRRRLFKLHTNSLISLALRFTDWRGWTG